MKSFIKLYLYLNIAFYYNVYAQVKTDGSMGNSHYYGAPLEIKPINNTITVSQNMGTPSGSNLFHSFNTFDINKGETVTFTSVNSFKNVISRVTGGEISHINGLLKSNIAGANFYFINPAGIFFDKNASVDVPAAFHVSTSDSLNFKDNTTFNAHVIKTSSLSIAEPTNFGFLNDKSGDINIQSSVYDSDNNFKIDDNFNLDGQYLHFDKKNDIVFNAKNIIFNAGILSSPLGNIHLNVKNSVILKNNSYIGNYDANSDGVEPSNTGDIIITAGNIEINNFSNIESTSYDDAHAGNIALQADVINLNLYGNIVSNANATGYAGEINLNAKTINLSNFSINSGSNGEGKAGDITMSHAKNIVISDNSIIFSDANNNGDAGAISINSDKFTLESNAGISSSTYALGNSSSVTIQASDININSGNIYSGAASNSNGKAGNINLTSQNMAITAGSTITSSTAGIGDAGTITLNNGDVLLIDNSQINSKADPNENAATVGNAGSITINSNELRLVNGGKVNSATYGNGKAGNIDIKASIIDISGQNDNSTSQILASAENSGVLNGRTGHINITANKLLHLYDNAQISIQNNATDTNPALFDNSSHQYSGSPIKGGTIMISSPNIQIENGGNITAQATGNIDAGQISSIFTHNLTLNHSIITTETNIGNGGNVTIKGGGIVNLQNDSLIKTFTKNESNTLIKGGDVNITADILMMNTAQILAKMTNTNGGYANLNLKALIPSQNQLLVNNQIVANFESNGILANILRTADSGWTVPQLNLNGSLSALNNNALNLPDLNKGSCNDVAISHSSLTKISKGGVPINEMQFIFVPPANNSSTLSNYSLQTVITPLFMTTFLNTIQSPCLLL